MNRFTNKNKRVVWGFRLLFLLVAFGAFSSCAPFNKNVKNPTRLNKTNFSQLNGRYAISSIREDSMHSIGRRWRYNLNFFKELDRKLFKDTLKLDRKSQYAFKLIMKNSKVLQVDYIRNDSIFWQRTLKAKITKDGYVKLKNKNFQIMLLPYIVGFIEVKRIRLTVDADRNLIFDVGEHRSGGVLIVMFDGKNYKYRKTYKRISDTTKTVNP